MPRSQAGEVVNASAHPRSGSGPRARCPVAVRGRPVAPEAASPVRPADHVGARRQRLPRHGPAARDRSHARRRDQRPAGHRCAGRARRHGDGGRSAPPGRTRHRTPHVALDRVSAQPRPARRGLCPRARPAGRGGDVQPRDHRDGGHAPEGDRRDPDTGSDQAGAGPARARRRRDREPGGCRPGSRRRLGRGRDCGPPQ